MTTRPLLTIALPLALLAAGCGQNAAEEAEAASATATPAETADAPATDAQAMSAPLPAEAIGDGGEPAPAPGVVPGTDAAILEDRAAPASAAPGFDAKAFEGRYIAGKTALQVTADGMFALDDNGTAIDGTWSLQPDGKTIVLDPDSKTEADRRIEVVSTRSLRLAGGAILQRHGGDAK